MAEQATPEQQRRRAALRKAAYDLSSPPAVAEPTPDVTPLLCAFGNCMLSPDRCPWAPCPRLRPAEVTEGSEEER